MRSRMGTDHKLALGLVSYGGHQASSIAAGRHRQILLGAVSHAPRNPALHIERPQPWPRTVLVTRHVKHRTLVNGRWVGQVIVVVSKLFRLPAAGRRCATCRT